MDKQRQRVAERAAEWVLRLNTADFNERLEFWHWLNESPLHVHEFLAAQATDTLLAHALARKKIPASSRRLLPCN